MRKTNKKEISTEQKGERTKMKMFKYVDPDKIEINEADFQLILRDYESCIKDKISWGDLLVLGPAWAILLTSNFDGISVFSGEILKGIYVAFIFLATVYTLKGRFTFLKKIFNNKHGAIKIINEIKDKCE